MTYLDLINGFFLWLESNALPASSRLMYLSLLNVFNRAGWPDDVQVDNRRLMSMAGVATEKSAIRARDALVSAGFITYRKGGSHNPNRYSLNLYCPQNSKNDSINDSIKYRENDSKNDSINDSLIKTKTKTKNPPKSPQGEDTFAAFWSAYPRKDSKAKAKASWDKLKPDKELVSRIMAALEQHKRSDQWNRDGGQYIPYPATWLNQRRWEDEGITPTQPEPPKKREYREIRDENGEVVSVSFLED